MKQIFAILICIYATVPALAGTYNLECSNKDKTILINRGTLNLIKDDGSQLEGIYFRTDGVALMFGAEIREFLKSTQSKFVIEQDLDAVGNPSIVKVLGKKHFKDECGNIGEQRKLRQDIRIYDASGNDVLLKKDTLFCTERAIPGHCL